MMIIIAMNDYQHDRHRQSSPFMSDACPRLSDDTIILPSGTLSTLDKLLKYPDGSHLTMSGAVLLNDESTATLGQVPSGGTVLADGTILLSSGALRYPSGATSTHEGRLMLPTGALHDPEWPLPKRGALFFFSCFRFLPPSFFAPFFLPLLLHCCRLMLATLIFFPHEYRFWRIACGTKGAREKPLLNQRPGNKNRRRGLCTLSRVCRSTPFSKFVRHAF